MKFTMSIKLNSLCQLIDSKYVILVNGIEYMICFLLEYLEFIEISHRFINEIVTCPTSIYIYIKYIYVEVGSVL